VLPRFLALAVVATLSRACWAGIMHPQDGPHADLRVAIEDDLVRYSVGVNLAFLDEAIDAPREALGELSAAEADRTLEGFRRLLLAEASCVINGEQIRPVFERVEIFTDPDPGMIAVFPKMGNRALIRAAAVMRFDAPGTTETVEVTWPAYPVDQLAEQMEGASSAPPRMYFEAVFTAGGKSSPARFTSAEPTIRWSRADTSGVESLADLPAPLVAQARSPLGIGHVAIGCSVLAAAGVGMTRRGWGSRAGLLAVVVVLLGVGAALPRATPSQPLVSEPEALEILTRVHESMYRAFDYTSESDIYDRLGLALEGELLGELYEQIRLSLLQAEEEMKIGVVTGLDTIETTIAEIDSAGPSAQGLGFDAIHRWRVDGTVYHWGHSHTRSNVYEARYRVAYTDRGWRITAHRLLSQQRIEPEAPGQAGQPDEIRRVLDQLGQPDI